MKLFTLALVARLAGLSGRTNAQQAGGGDTDTTNAPAGVFIEASYR